MARRVSEPASHGGTPTTGELNEAAARTWLAEFEQSEAFGGLGLTAQRSLAGAVRALARCATHRPNRAARAGYLLSEMTPEDALDLLTEQLPRAVCVLDPASLVDALTSFLAWAATAGAIRDRRVEYACRKNHRAALAAMMDEHKWSPGKEMVMLAMRDGTDPSDATRVRHHALGRGLAPSFVDEFLPPGPVLLANGNWLGLPE